MQPAASTFPWQKRCNMTLCSLHVPIPKLLSAPPRCARYPLNGEFGPATTASIEGHISAFFAGTLVEALKSAPVLAAQGGPCNRGRTTQIRFDRD